MNAHTKTLQALIDESLSHNGGIALGHCYLFGDELIALQELSATPLTIDEDQDTHDYRLGLTIRGTTKDAKPWAIRMFGVEYIRVDDADDDSHLFLDCKGWTTDQDPRRFAVALLKRRQVIAGKEIRHIYWSHEIGGHEIASGE